MLVRTLLLFVLGPSLALAQATLTGPATAPIGSEVSVTIGGKPNEREFVTIVPKASPEGTYDSYEYTRQPGALKLRAPATPGEYEIRLLGGNSPYPTLVKRPLKVESVTATFRHWADLGSGTYFDAKDAAGLGNALSQAMRPGFEIVNAQGSVVAEGLAGGDPVRVMPGDYAVRLKGQKGRTQPVTVKPKETAAVRI